MSAARPWVQVKGNTEEFVMYGLLHAAAASPKQLAIDMRDVPRDLWQHPFLQHALQVAYLPCPHNNTDHMRECSSHNQVSGMLAVGTT